MVLHIDCVPLWRQIDEPETDHREEFATFRPNGMGQSGDDEDTPQRRSDYVDIAMVQSC